MQKPQQGTIHKLRRQARGEGVSQMSMLLHKLTRCAIQMYRSLKKTAKSCQVKWPLCGPEVGKILFINGNELI